MSLIVKLPKYIFKGFIQDWLIANELALLDCSISRQRGVFINLIENLVLTAIVREAYIHKCCLWMVNRKCFLREFLVFPSLSNRKFSSKSMQASSYLSPVFSKLVKIDYYGVDCEMLFKILQFDLPSCNDIKIRYTDEEYSYQFTPLPTSLVRLTLCGLITCTSIGVIERLFNGSQRIEELFIEDTPDDYTLYGSEIFDFIIPEIGDSLKVLSIKGVHDEFHSILNLLDVYCPHLTSLSVKDQSRELNNWGIDAELKLRSVTSLSLCLAHMLGSNIDHFPNIRELKVLSLAKGSFGRSSNLSVMFLGPLLCSFPSILIVDVSDLKLSKSEIDDFYYTIKNLGSDC